MLFSISYLFSIHDVRPRAHCTWKWKPITKMEYRSLFQKKASSLQNFQSSSQILSLRKFHDKTMKEMISFLNHYYRKMSPLARGSSLQNNLLASCHYFHHHDQDDSAQFLSCPHYCCCSEEDLRILDWYSSLFLWLLLVVVITRTIHTFYMKIKRQKHHQHES